MSIQMTHKKSTPDTFLSDLLARYERDELETVWSLKRKCHERRTGYGALLVFAATALIQLLVEPLLTMPLMIGLTLLSASLPLLCLVTLFEQWQIVYARYDYLQHPSFWAAAIIQLEMVAPSLVVVGFWFVLLNIHGMIATLFGLTSLLSLVIYGTWRKSVVHISSHTMKPVQ